MPFVSFLPADLTYEARNEQILKILNLQPCAATVAFVTGFQPEEPTTVRRLWEGAYRTFIAMHYLKVSPPTPKRT